MFEYPANKTRSGVFARGDAQSARLEPRPPGISPSIIFARPLFFRRLAFWPRFPSAMHPEILFRRLARKRFDRAAVPLRDVGQRIIARLPILRINNVVYADAEMKFCVQPPGKSHANRNLKLHGQQPDRFKRAGLSPEEINE